MTYLNKQQQEDIIVIATMYSFLDEKIELWANLPKTDKKFLEYARRARTWLCKTLDLSLEGLDPLQHKNLLDRVSKHEIKVQWKSQAKANYLREKEMEEYVNMKEDHLFDLCEILVNEHCRGCCEDSGCRLRELLISYDIPVFDQDAKGCPYKI